MTIFKEYAEFDALGLAQLVQGGEISAQLLLEAAIERIERLNPALNAVVAKTYDLAQEQLKVAGPSEGSKLAGVPFLLKDLLSPLAGVRFTSGSRLLRNFIPYHDSELVRRYKAAGLIIVGKTSTPEFGIMPVTEPVLFGPCRNPWDLGYTPGGSSGGAAASVAAGIVPLAHGGDGGGSIRIPAACCGLFGLKPSRGRNPTGPDASEHWYGFAVEHALSRTVRDSAALLDVSAGAESTSPYWAPPRERPYLDEVALPPGKLRIAFTDKPHLPGRVHDDCREALRSTVALCESLGHQVEEASPSINSETFAQCFFTMICGSIAAGIRLSEQGQGRKPHRDELEVATWLAGLLGEEMSAGDMMSALTVLQAYAREILRFFERYDVLLTPTLGGPPLAIGQLEPQGAEALAHRSIANLKLGRVLRLERVIKATVLRVFDFIPFTPIANVTGQPSMSVPLYWNAQGLPIGSLFTGRLGAEGTLFRLAAQLEQARPWKHRRPPMFG